MNHLSVAAIVAFLFAAPVRCSRGQKGFVNPKAVANFNGQLLKAFETIKTPVAIESESNGVRHLAGMTDEETCESGLMSCRANLAACEQAEVAPKSLFIQMANQCTLTRSSDGTTYQLSSSDMDDDTYSFTDRPLQIEEVIPTSDFIEGFDATFSEETGGKPNAAFTFVHPDTEAFEGPLVAVQVDAMMSEEGVVTYVLEQSESQASVVDMEDFFDSADQVSFDSCSIFIDSATCVATAGYSYCKATDSCIRPWEPGTTQDCCNEAEGYAWRLGCTPTSSEGCCSATEEPPSPAPTESCVADGGFQYCPSQGCVQPWDPNTDAECCNSMPGWAYLLGCTPTATEGCCKSQSTPAPTEQCDEPGYAYCPSQGCVETSAPTTTETCCNEMSGYEWLDNCTEVGSSNVGCCAPLSQRRNLRLQR